MVPVTRLALSLLTSWASLLVSAVTSPSTSPPTVPASVPAASSSFWSAVFSEDHAEIPNILNRNQIANSNERKNSFAFETNGKSALLFAAHRHLFTFIE